MPKELNPKLNRGFAAMSPERLQEISRKGGKAVPAAKRAFSQDSKLAQAAGRKGLKIGRRKKVMVSQLENTDIEAVIETNKS